MDRLLSFVPSFWILGCIWFAQYLYQKWLVRKYKSKLFSFYWVSENETRVYLMITVPLMLIFAPTSEELIYRGPIIILSGYLPEYKWLLIIISAIVFGIMHWYGAKISLHEIQQNEPSDGYETDNLKEISKTISDQKNKKTYILKSAQVVSATIGGVLMGYYGIKYQTIWVSVLIHFSWNLFLLVLANLLQVVLLAYILVMRWVEYIRSQLSKKMGGSY